MLEQVLDFNVFPRTLNEDGESVDSDGLGEADDAAVLYCERFIEFLIDLLSQLPTRRYLPVHGVDLFTACIMKLPGLIFACLEWLQITVGVGEYSTFFIHNQLSYWLYQLSVLWLISMYYFIHSSTLR